MPPMLNPIWLITELGYTLFVIFFCFLIYYKTKEIYSLTKHKGVYYFRNTFLFFGLAYLFRFLFHMIRMSSAWLDLYLPRGVMGPLSMLFTGYLSTMAILCLIYSTIWKRISGKEFLIMANIIAIVIAVAAAYSPGVFMITQIMLLITAIVLSCFLRTKKGFPKITILYFLLFLFWILSLILFVPRMIIPFELRLIIEIISIALFAALYYKVAKWTK